MASQRFECCSSTSLRNSMTSELRRLIRVRRACSSALVREHRAARRRQRKIILVLCNIVAELFMDTAVGSLHKYSRSVVLASAGLGLQAASCALLGLDYGFWADFYGLVVGDRRK